MNRLILLVVSLLMAGCASRSVLPSVDEVKVSREEPSTKCKPMGKLTGTTSTAKGTQQEALADLKREAANKGANYLMVKEFSDYGTAVTALAYECP